MKEFGRETCNLTKHELFFRYSSRILTLLLLLNINTCFLALTSLRSKIFLSSALVLNEEIVLVSHLLSIYFSSLFPWIQVLLVSLQILPYTIVKANKGRYTYDVHENCAIFKTPPPPPLSSYVQNSSTLLTLDIQFKHPPPPPPALSLPFQMITNQLKEDIIQGGLLYVIRSFLRVGFCFKYQLINLV